MKRFIAAVCIVCAAAASAAAVIYAAGGRRDTDAVAYVDGEKIGYDEFMLIAGKKKFEIIKYFSNEYNAEYGNGFWTESFGGENPSEKMKEEVLKELVPIKLQQKLAAERGIAESSDYASIMDRLDTENAERKEKKENNMVVYGVTEYSPLQYYEDSLAKLDIALKEDMAENYFKPEESELRAFYEENKDIYYKTVNECEIVLYAFKDEVPDSAALEGFRAALMSGFDVEADIEAAGGSAEPCNINSQNEKLYSMEYPELAAVLTEADEGYITDIFYTERGAYFARFITVEKNVYKSYEEVEQNVLDMYVDELFEEYMSELVENADIEKGAAYDSISFIGI